MVVSIEEFNKMKSQVESLQRKADKAEGALEQTKALLKSEFGCNSVEEARELAQKYKEEAEELERKFEKSQTKFQNKWGEVLND